MAKWKRYVVGAGSDGLSRVLASEADNVKDEPGMYYRVDLWCTAEMPVDNTDVGDRGKLSRTRAPLPNGTVFRALEIPPDSSDAGRHRKAVAELHAAVEQKHMPTEADYARHPTVHRTDTLDYIVCVTGEITLVTDAEEVVMRPGDSVVIRGTNHGWANYTDTPALLVGVMVDALPSA